MKYIKGFDTVRAIAVLLVIVDKYHWGPDFSPHSAAGIFKEVFIPNGVFGVNLFFVLSGFLITGILLNEKIHKRAGLTTIKNFFIRRFLRIFPIYYITVLVLHLLNYQFVKTYLVYFLTYTSNMLQYKTEELGPLMHTWSLAVEEQFYLIWPWLIVFINKKYLKYVFVASIIIGIGFKYFEMCVLHHVPHIAFSCFDSFGLGALYAYVRLNDTLCRRFERGFVILFPFMLFMLWRVNPFSGQSFFLVYSKFTDSVICLAVVMFVIKNKSEWISKHIFENRPLNFIGKISYGIYLYHYPLGLGYDSFIIGIVKRHPGLPALFSNFYFSYCIKLTLLFLLSWLSFRLVEQPILRLKKRFEYA